MDEEKKDKQMVSGETETTEDSGEGDKPTANTIVDDTNLAAKRMEEATKAAIEERLAAEESYAKMRLGGRSEAGSVAEKPKVSCEFCLF